MNAATPERKPVIEEISGLIERVTFHNDESGFCVLRVKTPGHQEETTVVGSLPSVTAGVLPSSREKYWLHRSSGLLATGVPVMMYRLAASERSE